MHVCVLLDGVRTYATSVTLVRALPSAAFSAPAYLLLGHTQQVGLGERSYVLNCVV